MWPGNNIIWDGYAIRFKKNRPLIRRRGTLLGGRTIVIGSMKASAPIKVITSRTELLSRFNEKFTFFNWDHIGCSGPRTNPGFQLGTSLIACDSGIRDRATGTQLPGLLPFWSEKAVYSSGNQILTEEPADGMQARFIPASWRGINQPVPTTIQLMFEVMRRMELREEVRRCVVIGQPYFSLSRETWQSLFNQEAESETWPTLFHSTSCAPKFYFWCK
jgi:hypothetical protein